MRWIWLMVLMQVDCAPAPVSPPTARGEVQLPYPEQLWDAGVEGETVLRVYVGAAGGADSVLADRSSGYPGFDQAALDGVASMNFEPARRGNEPIGLWVRIPVQFRLQPDSM